MIGPVAMHITFVLSPTEGIFPKAGDYGLALDVVREFAEAEGGTVAIQDSTCAGINIIVKFEKSSGPAFGPAFGAAVNGWFQKKTGRSLRLKIRDIDIHADNQLDLERLLEQAIANRELRSDARLGQE